MSENNKLRQGNYEKHTHEHDAKKGRRHDNSL